MLYTCSIVGEYFTKLLPNKITVIVNLSLTLAITYRGVSIGEVSIYYIVTAADRQIYT